MSKDSHRDHIRVSNVLPSQAGLALTLKLEIPPKAYSDCRQGGKPPVPVKFGQVTDAFRYP